MKYEEERIEELSKKRVIDLTGGELADVIIAKMNLSKPAEKVEERYLSPKEVSSKLKVSLSTLWRWNKSGYLKNCEVGGKRLYRESDIEERFKGR